MNYYDYLFKFILIGDSNVGKSAILMQFIYSRFKKDYEPTIGVEFGSKQIKLNEKCIVKTQIWDTSGQESFRSITRSYYRGSIGVILVYDVTNKESFENLKNWINETKNYGHEHSFIILLGNKIDCIEKREISFDEGELFAKENNLLFFETSAKTGENIEKSFILLSENIYKKIQEKIIDPNNENNGIKIGNKEESMKINSSKLMIISDGPKENKNKYSFFNKNNCCSKF